MLGAPCSACCGSCDDLVLASGVAFPSVNVSYSTSGFAAGQAAGGGGAFYGTVTQSRQTYYRTLYEFTVSGAWYEASGLETLLPGTKPALTTQSGTGYVPFPAYLKTWSLVPTDTAGISVNPYIAVRFRCGSQSSAFASGNYLWASAYVNIPVFTSTWQYTQTWANSAEDFVFVKSYATSETGDVPPTSASSGTLNLFHVPASGEYFGSFASPGGQFYLSGNPWWQNDSPASPVGGLHNLLIYTANRPATLPANSAGFGSPVSLNKYGEQGEVAFTETITVATPGTVYRYKYINMETPYVLSGEFIAGQYALYPNTALASNIYGQIDATSSRASPFVSRNLTPGPNASRMPWFAKSLGTQAITAFGIAQSSTTGNRIVTNVPGPDEFYGVWYPDSPGSPYTENLKQGPSVAITINPQ
jgi:hypothetical protein